MTDKQRRFASNILQRMYRDLQKNPCPYFSCGLIDNDVFKWRVTIIGQPGTVIADSFLPAEITFPVEFPNMPPKMKFNCPMWHPNINKDGRVCISILHEPGVDRFNEQELERERWLPIHTVETIVISVISMLGDPNPQSPENVEANRDFMNDKPLFWKKFKEYCMNGMNYC